VTYKFKRKSKHGKAIESLPPAQRERAERELARLKLRHAQRLRDNPSFLGMLVLGATRIAKGDFSGQPGSVTHTGNMAKRRLRRARAIERMKREGIPWLKKDRLPGQPGNLIDGKPTNMEMWKRALIEGRLWWQVRNERKRAAMEAEMSARSELSGSREVRLVKPQDVVLGD
jgi:hypothetical protein